MSPHTMLSAPCHRAWSLHVTAPRCSVSTCSHSGCDPLHRNVETDTSPAPAPGGSETEERQGYGHRLPGSGWGSSGSGSLHTCISEIRAEREREREREQGTGHCTHPGSRCDQAQATVLSPLPHPLYPLEVNRLWCWNPPQTRKGHALRIA